MSKTPLQSLALALIVIAFSIVSAAAQKLTAEEVVAKHLDAIGTKEKRDSIKNLIVLADVKFDARGSTIILDGRGVILSERDKNIWGFNLNANTYPQDRFAFDGRETRVGFITPGARSALGGFILSYKEVLREGLLGGALLSSWTLLNRDAKKTKIDYDGMKKIDDREVHVLSVVPKGGSDLNIKMYFDAKNFRHVRTEYSRTISARQGASVDSSSSQSPTYYRLTENFGDFQTVNGLTIPQTYKIFYSVTGASVTTRNSQLEWLFSVSSISVNQELDQNSFNIDAK